MYGNKTGSNISTTDLGSALNIYKKSREDVQFTVEKSEEMLIGLTEDKARKTRTSSEKN